MPERAASQRAADRRIDPGLDADQTGVEAAREDKRRKEEARRRSQQAQPPADVRQQQQQPPQPRQPQR